MTTNNLQTSKPDPHVRPTRILGGFALFFATLMMLTCTAWYAYDDQGFGCIMFLFGTIISIFVGLAFISLFTCGSIKNLTSVSLIFLLPISLFLAFLSFGCSSVVAAINFLLLIAFLVLDIMAIVFSFKIHSTVSVFKDKLLASVIISIVFFVVMLIFTISYFCAA